MSPRPAVTRHDRTAIRLMTAAAQLIDQSMGPAGHQHPRLRSIRFPAALDWMRIEDVLRTAADHPEGAISKKALVNRWETREEFLRDAIVYAMLYTDDPPAERMGPDELDASGDHSFAEGVTAVIERLYGSLVAHPRSFLLCQFAPYFGLHPQMAAQVAAAGVKEQQRWTEVYTALTAGLPVGLRPEWTPERAGAALQCVLDGFVLRQRINPTTISGSSWSQASLLADTVLALLAGMLDLGGDQATGRDHLDRHLDRARIQPTDLGGAPGGHGDRVMISAWTGAV